MFNWKELLKSVLYLLLPLIYGLIIKAIPGFPITEAGFIDTVIWLIFGIILGGQALRVRYAYKMAARGDSIHLIKEITNIGG